VAALGIASLLGVGLGPFDPAAAVERLLDAFTPS